MVCLNASKFFELTTEPLKNLLIACKPLQTPKIGKLLSIPNSIIFFSVLSRKGFSPTLSPPERIKPSTSISSKNFIISSREFGIKIGVRLIFSRNGGQS